MGGGGYWSDSDSDSDSYTFDALDLDRVQVLGARFGYQQCQLDYGEGVVAFSRPGGGSDGNELVRVWWRTGTVGTYLKVRELTRYFTLARGVSKYTQISLWHQNVMASLDTILPTHTDNT